MSKGKKKLTNEELTKHFTNPFELVNHAIDVAKHLVQAGHELAEVGDRNSASIVLKKVLKEREAEEKAEELLEKKGQITDDKEYPDPLLQVV